MKLAYKVILEVNEADEFTADNLDKVVHDRLLEFLENMAELSADIGEVDVVTVKA